MLRGLLVCLHVGHDRQPCKNGGTDQDAVSEADSPGPKKPCVSWRELRRRLANTIKQFVLGSNAGSRLH